MKVGAGGLRGAHRVARALRIVPEYRVAGAPANIDDIEHVRERHPERHPCAVAAGDQQPFHHVARYTGRLFTYAGLRDRAISSGTAPARLGAATYLSSAARAS